MHEWVKLLEGIWSMNANIYFETPCLILFAFQRLLIICKNKTALNLFNGVNFNCAALFYFMPLWSKADPVCLSLVWVIILGVFIADIAVLLGPVSLSVNYEAFHCREGEGYTYALLSKYSQCIFGGLFHEVTLGQVAVGPVTVNLVTASLGALGRCGVWLSSWLI